MRKLLLVLLCIPLITAQALETKDVKWIYKAGYSILASPAIHNGVIFLGSANGYFYALNLTDGMRMWEYGRVGKIESSPAISDTMVFFGSDDGYLYALNLDGSLAWKFKTNGGIQSSPLVAYNLVYFASSDENVYSLKQDGKMLWKYSGEAPFISSPLASNWIIYIGSDDDTLYAFNAFNGSVLWKREFPGKIQSDFAISPENVLYFSCKDGNIYAVYAGDGSKIWNITTGTESQSSVRYDPATGFTYFGTSDNNIYAANSTGQVVWSYETGDWVVSTPLLLDGVLYVGSYDGNLYAISTVRTSFSSSEMNVIGSPVLVTGTSYADAGVSYVQVRVDYGGWQNASGTSSWRYDWDTSSLQDGNYTFNARAVDSLNDEESQPYATATLHFLKAGEGVGMVVSFPQSVVAGAPIDFQVNDTDGNPVPYPQVAIFGNSYTGNKDGFVSSDADGNPIKSDENGDFNFTVSKEGYSTYSGTIRVVPLGDTIPYIIELAAVLALLLVVLFFGARKFIKMMKKQ